MKRIMNRIIKILFGTQNNILQKLNGAFFISGVLFLIFSVITKDQNNPSAYNTFLCISAILFSLWLVLAQNNSSILEFIFELVRLFMFFCVLILSLNFCINTSVSSSGVHLIIYSILSCVGIICCSFYLTAKFIDIFAFVKRLINQIKQNLFNSAQPATSKIKSLIENITAFLVAIAGLGVAIKTIIEPLINLFK